MKSNRKTIGILGGGQLARMSAYQAYKLGFNIAILEKKENSPAGMMTKKEFVGWVDDKKTTRDFTKASDVVTLENEFVDYQRLEFIESLGKKVIPSPKTISLIQDKYIQKNTLQRNKIPVADFLKVDDKSTYEKIAKKLGEKFILKSRKMGYDGYGNYSVKKEKDFSEGIKKLTSRHSELMAEKFIDFDMELAIMVARSEKEIKCYPVVQTIQKNHICHTVIAPADLRKTVSKKAEEIAVEAVKAIKGFGIFGIEMFIVNGKEILVNEMAPRPHNSGHYTIEGCVTPQFENHIRAVLNLPLGSTDMVKPYAVMINLLGKREGEGIVENYDEVLANDKIHLHIYGKEKSRFGRKMGHITVLGDNLKKTLNLAKVAEKIANI
ncbi:MAG TPA: 5-(carboxyamino)imidazole ribonucleotide synthase [Ignavibacteriaceae bacterium]|nr:5-(carboxyamino)imidazole ribonucleotide synthase [Ignavibacteriaceae bacterium]